LTVEFLKENRGENSVKCVPNQRGLLRSSKYWLWLALIISPTVWAHGSEHHGKADAAVSVSQRAEQKPFGIAGNPKKLSRTILIDMTDNMRFTPAAIDVKQGETIRFTVRNQGSMLHELVLGTAAELQRHAALMKKFPNMEHDEPHMLHVPAGETANMVWRFNRPGTFKFACLIAGHYESGMIGSVTVSPKR
jgi:uncharacterized cupredoxin-like copper-binding protein